MNKNKAKNVKKIIEAINALRLEYTETTIDYEEERNLNDIVVKIDCPYFSAALAIATMLDEHTTLSIQIENNELTVR